MVVIRSLTILGVSPPIEVVSVRNNLESHLVLFRTLLKSVAQGILIAYDAMALVAVNNLVAFLFATITSGALGI